MPKLRITKEDIDRQKIPEQGWYRATLEKIEEQPSKDKSTMNSVLHLKLVEDQNGEPVDKTVLHFVNHKYPGFAIPIVEAFEQIVLEAEHEFDLEDYIGKDVYVMIKHRTEDVRTGAKLENPQAYIDVWQPENEPPF